MKMGRYGTKNGSSKVTKHFSFSLLLDGKLTCTCRLRRTPFLVEGLNGQVKNLPNLKIRHFG